MPAAQSDLGCHVYSLSLIAVKPFLCDESGSHGTNSLTFEGHPMRRQTITATVFEYLMELVRTRTIAPGERLPTEKELIDKLGVSRSCVREAIKSLEALQIVVVRPKSG